MSVEQLDIRSYDEARDRDALVGLWDRCNLLVWYNDPHRDLAQFASTVSAEVFVGYDGDALVASCCAGFDGHRGWLYFVAVDPERRGEGYGRRLVRSAESWLKSRNVAKVQLIVRPNNQDVTSFYEALDYERNPCLIYQRWLRDLGPPPSTEARQDGKIENTITYLEMTERPALAASHPPRGSNVALFRAKQPPLAFYRFLYETVGEPWLWWERRQLGDDEVLAIIHDPLVEIYVLNVNGAPAGFFELDRRSPPEIELALFGLMPDFIGRKLGGYLLSSTIDIAWSYSPQRLILHTNSLDHPRALPLYQRLGFKPYKQVSRLIDDPRESGLFPR